MNFGRDKYPFRIVPNIEDKCIWMMAGVISYKLCNRNYLCETCPLHLELSSTATDENFPRIDAEKISESRPPMFRGPLFYHPDHIWVRVEGPRNVVIGLDDFIVKLLSTVKCIDMPRPDEAVRLGEYIAVVMQDLHSFPITCPISGRVQGLNSRLQKDPQSLVEDSMNSGWMLSIAPDDLQSELKYLMTGRRAIEWRQREIDKLETMINTLGPEERRSLGPVLQDGKPRLESLSKIVGPEKYYKIVLSFMQPDRGSE